MRLPLNLSRLMIVLGAILSALYFNDKSVDDSTWIRFAAILTMLVGLQWFAWEIKQDVLAEVRSSLIPPGIDIPGGDISPARRAPRPSRVIILGSVAIILCAIGGLFGGLLSTWLMLDDAAFGNSVMGGGIAGFIIGSAIGTYLSRGAL
jgi:hypothetical protein